MIVDPPDHLLAAEMAEGSQELGQARVLNSITDAVKSVSSDVSLQEQGKVRLTPAARQWHEIQNTMLSYIQKTTADGDASDDELDLAFSSMAKRMCLHLNKTQKEQVLFKIQNVVGDCINNVLEGNPVNGPNQQFRPPVQQNIMHANPPNPAAGDQMGFFQEGRQTITYNSTGDFPFQNL